MEFVDLIGDRAEHRQHRAALDAMQVILEALDRPGKRRRKK